MKWVSLKKKKHTKNLIFSLLAFLFMYTNILSIYVKADDRILNQGREVIKSYYLNEVPDNILQKDNLKDIIKALNDPYSEYFTSKEYQDFENMINKKFTGIGIGVEMVTEGIKVSYVIEKSPALEVGIKSGDIIIEAGGQVLKGLTADQAIKYVKGEEGTFVKLLIKRESSIISFNVERRAIVIPTVKSELLLKNIGYIQVSSFGFETPTLFSKAINDMEKANVQGYIIDLRNNGGGYLQSALGMAGHFIGNNLCIVMKDKQGQEEKYLANSQEKVIDKPVIFLINNNSASASEILSAAVKDYDKATFIGVNSYGKGVAQSSFRLFDNSVLKLTTEQFFSPKGKTINKVGVSPNLEVKDEEINSLYMATLLLGNNNLTNNNGYAKVKIENKEYNIDLKKARMKEYWKSYDYLMKKLSPNNIFIGEEKGWNNVSSTDIKCYNYLSDKIKMYYNNYNILPELNKNNKMNKDFNIKFSNEVNMESLKAEGVELIREGTGERILIDIKSEDKKNITITPKSKLESGQVYYLVVNDNVKSSLGNKIKGGTAVKYTAP